MHWLMDKTVNTVLNLVQRIRGIVTAYAYNVYGDLVSQTYSDGTPSVTYAYDALGRQTQATDAVGTTAFGYNAYGELETEAIAGLYTKTLTHHIDAYGRDAGYGVNGSRRTSSPFPRPYTPANIGAAQSQTRGTPDITNLCPKHY